jgi:hypothetical protein
VVIPVILVIVIVNILGTRANRTRAKKWASTYLPMLDGEFASIGFDHRKQARVSDAKEGGLSEALAGSTEVPEDMLKEKSKSEYIAYCTGRQNVAWLDIKITLYKRYNPLAWFGETAMAFFSDSMPDPVERVEATAYCYRAQGQDEGSSRRALRYLSDHYQGPPQASQLGHRDERER